MDRGYSYPILIELSASENANIEAIRNLYFSNIYARGLHMPMLIGRKDKLLENICFNDCTFETTHPPENDKQNHGAVHGAAPSIPSLILRDINGLTINNTKFVAR